MNTSKQPEWKAIEQAPRDGQLLLLCVPDGNRVRSPWEPDDRHVHGHYGLVGKWCDVVQSTEEGWIGDLRTLDTVNGSQVWIYEQIEPTHWMHLPQPPPSNGWHDAMVTTPPLKTYALIYDPRVRAVRGYPKDSLKDEDAKAMMVVGCPIDTQPNFLPLWATDLVEEGSDSAFRQDLAEDSEHLVQEQVTLAAPYWYELPPPP